MTSNDESGLCLVIYQLYLVIFIFGLSVLTCFKGLCLMIYGVGQDCDHGVATIRRLHKMIGLFCKRAL